MSRCVRRGRFCRFGAITALAVIVLIGAIAVVSQTSLANATPRQVAGASGQGRAECRDVNSKILRRAVPYCIFLPPSYDSNTAQRYPVLYFLHGLGENEQVLLNSDGWQIIEQAWSDKTLGEFVIVAPAAGRSFYINSKDGKVRYEDFFIQEFLPIIEKNYRIRATRATRGLDGISMGGYGALRFAFKYPKLFGSVSAHSAALIERPPTVQINPQQQAAVTRLVGTAFGVPFDRAYWNRESPFTIVRDNPRPVGLKIYFDCGTKDDFGFNVGAQQFHDLLEKRGIPNTFHLYPGGHNWMYFAEHFPDSLEFESKAFGLTAGQ
ncbi:MAG TPA: alpha/beta hydrolase family protein [Candidatus Acidoferrales bacterium]|nr:alpha/beta hydrolase family protein [Candidatus Acidoferrales bacterium]